MSKHFKIFIMSVINKFTTVKSSRIIMMGCYMTYISIFYLSHTNKHRTQQAEV